MYIPSNSITTDQAEAIYDVLSQYSTLTENRLLILSPLDQEVKVGSIIVPGSAKEDRQNKGALILTGHIDKETTPDKYLYAHPGVILTYGMYAGKKVDFPKELLDKIDWSNSEPVDFTKHQFTVLSLTEVILVEDNL